MTRRFVTPGWLWPLLAGATFRFGLLFTWEGAETDGITRTLYAEQWLKGLKPLFGVTTWPELNYILPALAIRVGRDSYWAPRILFAIISLLLIPAVWHLSRRLADRGDARTVAWSAALLPSIALFSTSGARSELIAAIGTMIALIGFLRWDYGRGRLFDVLLAASGVVVTEGMRFDGVLVGAVLGSILLADVLVRPTGPDRTQRVSGMLIFGAACLVYPVALAVKWNATYGDPLHFLHTAQVNTRQFLDAGGHSRWPKWIFLTYSLAFVPVAIGYLLTPVVTMLCLLGAWCSRLTWKTAPLFSVLLVQWAFIVKNVLSFTQQTQLRYALPLGLLLLPFLSEGFRVACGIGTRCGIHRARALLTVAVVCGVVAVEGIAAVSTTRQLGVLTRQLSGTGLWQVNQFAASRALQEASTRGQNGDRLLLQAFVGSPYAQLSKTFREGKLSVVHMPIYQTTNLVYELSDYQEELERRLSQVRFAIVNTSPEVLGFKNGILASDPLGAAVNQASAAPFRWRSLSFRSIGTFGSIALLERIPSATP